MLDLQSTFARVLHISTATPSPVFDQSAMAATRGRGHGSSRRVVVAVQTVEDVHVALTVDGQVIGSTDVGI